MKRQVTSPVIADVQQRSRKYIIYRLMVNHQRKTTLSCPYSALEASPQPPYGRCSIPLPSAKVAQTPPRGPPSSSDLRSIRKPITPASSLTLFLSRALSPSLTRVLSLLPKQQNILLMSPTRPASFPEKSSDHALCGFT